LKIYLAVILAFPPNAYAVVSGVSIFAQQLSIRQNNLASCLKIYVLLHRCTHWSLNVG